MTEARRASLLGWAGAASAAPPELVLAGMMGMRGAAPSALQIAQATSAAALAVRAAHVDGDARAEGALAVAIVGRPRWQDRDLAEIAKRQGAAAALLEAWRRRGEHLLRDLRGAFAVAVLDGAAGRRLLAIDRFGLETLCYSEPAPGQLVFGSTADLVRRHPAVRSTVPPQAIFDYLYFGISPSPSTIYREQSKL